MAVTEAGVAKVEKTARHRQPLRRRATASWSHHLDRRCAAQTSVQRDMEYVVKDGEIIIVDEFTGRLMPGRR